MAGPRHTRSPPFTILRPPFHMYIIFLLYTIQHALSLSSSRSLSFHSSLHNFKQQPIASKNMTNPVPLSCYNCIHKTSTLSNLFQNFVIAILILPTCFCNSSPYPHLARLKSLNFFFSQRPCFATVQQNWPHNSL